MPHHFFDLGLIVFIAAMAAVLSGFLKQLPMIGYVVAGALLGPAVLGVIESEQDIRFVAEMGVVLLLFILGMELPLASFRQSYKVALPTTLALVLLSLLMLYVISLFVSLSLAEVLVYGFIISLSSTAIAVKLLEDVDLKNSGTGQIAISVLISQDLLFVPMIMIVGALGSGGKMDLWFVPKLLAAVLFLVLLIQFLSKKQQVRLVFHRQVERHRDLIPVAALAWCFTGAGLSEWAGFSPAYGAFLAGLVIGNSHSKHLVLEKVEPMQSVLLMVFFLSIGMLIDFNVILNHFGLVLALLLGAMLFKTLVCISLLKLFLPAERWRCSFVTGLTISQIGEFSFILANGALANGIFGQESYKTIIAVIALSLALSPLWMTVMRRFVQIAYVEKSASSMSGCIPKIFSFKGVTRL